MRLTISNPKKSKDNILVFRTLETEHTSTNIEMKVLTPGERVFLDVDAEHGVKVTKLIANPYLS